MGQCVIIGCRPTWDLETFVPAMEEMAAKESAILLRFSDQLQLSDVDREWKLIVHPVSDQRATLAEYESDPELDEQFRAEAHDLRFFVVRYNDIDRVRRLIRSAAQRAVSLGESAWIDTDYGWVISAERLLNELRFDPHWDWRVQNGPR